MKALVQHRYGAPAEVLRLEEVGAPVVGAREVLVAVEAAGVNWADWALTRGEPYMLRAVYGLRRPRVAVRGMDVAGTVVEVGAAVAGLRPGDRVFGWCVGAFAERAVVRAGHCVAIPDGVTAAQAAGMPMAGMVALQALRDVAAVRPGQHVLVNGASGGIGTFAVQIASALGAEVTGVCSTPNLALVRSLGADHVLDYTREDFTTLGERYDLVLDMADDRSLAARRAVLTDDGTLIPNSGHGGRWFGSVGRILRARLLSPFVAQRLRPFYSAPSRDDLVELGRLVTNGAVTPVVGRTYPLADAASAVEHVGHGHVRGKVVVLP